MNKNDESDKLLETILSEAENFTRFAPSGRTFGKRSPPARAGGHGGQLLRELQQPKTPGEIRACELLLASRISQTPAPQEHQKEPGLSTSP